MLTRAVYVAVELGIPDLLKDHAKSAQELAEATATHAPSLRRVLRVLVSAGLLSEDDQGQFALTSTGATLRHDVPDSLRAWVLLSLGEENYRAWGDVLHSVKTGEPAFNHVFGMGVWEYRAQHPEQARTFDEAMANLGTVVNESIQAGYDFSSVRRLVDVGGGNGSLLAFLLKTNPKLQGIVFDLPHVVHAAKGRIAVAGLADRCGVIVGSFFDTVPEGADAYLLSRVIHDWDDARSIAILRTCRRAMRPESKLLLVERVLPARLSPSPMGQALTGSDFNMLVMTGGLERTEAEYRALFDAAGLRLTKIVPTRSWVCVIEAVPA